MTERVDRTEALRLWRDIADDSLNAADYGPFDLHAWLRSVAAALIEADAAPAKDRQRLIVEAVQLSGHLNGHEALDTFLVGEVLPAEDFDAVGDGTPSDRGTIAWVVSEARRRGLLAPTYEFDEKKARELIRRRIAAIRPKEV